MSNEMVEDALLEVPPVIVMDAENAETNQGDSGHGSTPANNQEKPQNRFAHPASTEEIDSLAAEKQSRLTITQTRWAVKIFRGEFNIIFD